MRRAVRHGHRLGVRDPFFWRMVAPLDAEMGDAYPELRRRRAQVERILRQEEEQFARTLDQGMRILEDAIDGLDGRMIPGETVFRLYDTYGFPVDLTADIARERSLEVDMDAFERAMEGQRARARASSRFRVEGDEAIDVAASSTFVGYGGSRRPGDGDRAAARRRGGGPARSEEEGWVVLDETPFYAEAGGQVGDRGRLVADGIGFEITDTQRYGDAIVHVGVVTGGALSTGTVLDARVDARARRATARNHSATHLLHAALAGGARRACRAEGLPGRAGSPPVRLLPLRTGHEGGTAPYRGHGLGVDPRQRRGPDRGHAARRGQAQRRDRAVRREVRRPGASALPRRLLGGALRRHPRVARGRRGPVQDRLRGGHRGGRAPGRGPHRRGGARLGAFDGGTGSSASRAA